MADVNSIGALRTDITLTLQTQYATRLWQGKNVNKDNKQITRIISVPVCLSILNRITQHAAQDDPYADAYLMKIESKILSTREDMAKLADKMTDIYAENVPGAIELKNSFNVDPAKIPLAIRSSIGYQLIYLLADFDYFTTVAMTAAHIAIMPRQEVRNLVEQAAHLVRSVFGLIQRYQDAGVSRADIKAGTANALAAIARFGKLPEDILSGKTRSQFAPVNIALFAEAEDNDEKSEAVDKEIG